MLKCQIVVFELRRLEIELFHNVLSMRMTWSDVFFGRFMWDSGKDTVI